MSGARQQCGCSPWTGPSGFWREPGRGLEQARTQGNQHTLGFGDSRASRLVSVWFGFCSLLEAQVSVLKSKVTMTQLTRQHNPLLGSRNTFPAFISNCKSKQPPTYFLKLISSSLVTLKGFKSDQILCVCVCGHSPSFLTRTPERKCPRRSGPQHPSHPAQPCLPSSWLPHSPAPGRNEPGDQPGAKGSQGVSHPWHMPTHGRITDSTHNGPKSL